MRNEAQGPANQTTKAIGDALERVVAAHYEALGYRVAINVSLGEHQIDLLASRTIPGAGTFTLMVEVKSRQGNLGIGEVTTFKTTATDLMQDGLIQGAVLITNGVISERARGKMLGAPGLRLATLSELESDLFNFSESLLRSRYDYETSAVAAEYIPLRGTRFGASSEGEPEKSGELDDVAQFLVSWATGREPLLVLAGDFGSGKTTVLERVMHELVVARLQDREARFPIWLPLRSLLRYPDLWSFIEANLKEWQQLTPTRAAFEAKMRAGGFVFLLDGFDEIHTGADAEDRAKYLRLLAPLFASGSPSIVSTRPTYFESFKRMAHALVASLDAPPVFQRIKPDAVNTTRMLRRLNLRMGERLHMRALANIVELSSLSEEKVLDYIRGFERELWNRVARSPEEVKDFLFRIYDLQDLMRRPLLLKMVLVTLLEGGVDIAEDDTQFGPSSLYEMYTQGCAERDRERGDAVQFLSAAERLMISRGLALRMLDRNTLELNEKEVRDVIAQLASEGHISGTNSEARKWLERASTDVRVCSYLRFGDAGLRFAHKSYQEYFVAQAFVLEMEQQPSNAVIAFAHRSLPREIVYFLGSYARDYAPFGRALRDALRSQEGDARTNYLLRRVAFASGAELAHLHFEGGSLEDVDLRRASVGRLVFASVTWLRVGLRDVTAYDWQLSRVAASGVELERCAFYSCSLDLRGHDLRLEDVSFQNSDLKLSGPDWSVRGLVSRSGSVRLAGRGYLDRAAISGAREVTIDGLRLENGSACTFEGCVVIGASAQPWCDETATIEFKDCALCGVWIDIADLAAAAGRSTWSAVQRVQLQSCRGVALCSEAPGGELGQHLGELFPDLIFLGIDQLGRKDDKRATVELVARTQSHLSRLGLAERAVGPLRQWLGKGTESAA